MTTPLLEVKDLVKTFKVSTGWMPWMDKKLHAVNEVSFSIGQKETVGIAGESGCGKSTLAWCLMGLYPITSGTVKFQGKELLQPKNPDLKTLRQNVQMVFQDPYDSLNPRRTIGELVGDPLQIQTNLSKKEIRERVLKLLDDVGLPASSYNKFPGELSGGQRQRVGIARALIVNPELIIADEAVASLDVSIQAQVLNLFADLQEERNLSYLFITHDLSVLRHMADRIIIMYLGEIVEIGTNEEIYHRPAHPYTQALLASATDASSDVQIGVGVNIEGEIPSPIDRPVGCPFAPRCPIAQDICVTQKPELRTLENGTQAACHFPAVPAAEGSAIPGAVAV
ncbi:ABC transporter ATP-binding protein [Leucobacter salsicius]|uniref:ABC transporter ATP-binding protein n=1 Tax=Leucobacter salsicius TaxID=664638 RepID=UPI000347C9B9|nr:ABC transporter ATP-binding protein [Leucobacter salsicius]